MAIIADASGAALMVQDIVIDAPPGSSEPPNPIDDPAPESTDTLSVCKAPTVKDLLVPVANPTQSTTKEFAFDVTATDGVAVVVIDFTGVSFGLV